MFEKESFPLRYGKIYRNTGSEKGSEGKGKISIETLGKFFYDLAKTSFTVMVAGSAVSFFTDKVQTPYWLLLATGVFVTTIFACIGYTIIKR